MSSQEKQDLKREEEESLVQKKIKTESGDMRKPLLFKVVATQLRARACEMILPHGPVNTPVYMPVGTKGSVKGLTSE